MLVEINIAGGTYAHRSRPLSAQKTINFWPQIQDGAGTSQYILEAFPGLKSFSAGSGSDRGMFEHLGTLYDVTGTTLASVSSAGVRTTLATIPGTSRCVFGAITNTIIIVSDGVAYTWNGSSLTTATDVDFETPQSVAVVNQQAIYDGDDSRFCVSDVGDPLNINSLNYATAEAFSDTLTRTYAFNQEAIMFGQKHIERWWNSGNGNPPFDRIEGGIYQVGLGAFYSVANNQNYLYFFGSDRNLYRLGAGGIEANFTPRPLLREFLNYDTVSDAVGWCMNFQGQEFYVLKFTAENVTWIYPEGGQWFQLASEEFRDVAVEGRYRASSYAYAYGKHLVKDEVGNILELDESTYTDNSDSIIRVRDTAPLHGSQFGQTGKTMTLTEFKLLMETGVGGPGENPQIMLSFSTDGGRTFGNEVWGSVGQAGDFTTPVDWAGLNVSGETIIARIKTSGAFYYSVHSAAAEIEFSI